MLYCQTVFYLFFLSILFWFHSFVKKLIIRCYAKIILKLWKTLSFHVNISIGKTIEPLAFLPSNSILDSVSGPSLHYYNLKFFLAANNDGSLY